MYTIKSIQIDGFWHQHQVHAIFNSEVNVIIGRNGTGKTTFMNILQGILSVDLDALQQNQFDTATIILINESGRRRQIKATRAESPGNPLSFIEYKISKKKYRVVLLPGDDRARPTYVRRRANEQAGQVRDELKQLISLASLSVYRTRSDIEFEAHDRLPPKKYASPVDVRLTELMQRLTYYQLELSQKSQDVAEDLQKQVLTSLLYEKEKNPNRISLTFAASEEKQKLQQAYAQLGVTGSGISKRINEHITSIETAVKALEKGDSGVEFAAFEARRRTDKVVKLSLAAREKTEDIYRQINLFLALVRDFIEDKGFKLVGGDLMVEVAGDPLDLDKLSSGEKQLLILLVEALLQKQEPYVFLADEPELSLHIAWQRKIVPAVARMNPNAQVIVATHSPEIAGRYGDATIDMEDMLNGQA